MTTPQMDLHDTLAFWQREVNRDNADPRERTRDGVASSTLAHLRAYDDLLERLRQEELQADLDAWRERELLGGITPENAHGEWPGE